MAARLIDYCEALLPLIDAGSYSEAITSVRKNVPDLEREDLTGLICWVSPGGAERVGLSSGSVDVPATRGGQQHLRQFAVQVHLAKSADPTSNTDTDALLLITEQVEAELLSTAREVLTGRLLSISTEMELAESVRLRAQFEATITLIYQEAV